MSENICSSGCGGGLEREELVQGMSAVEGAVVDVMRGKMGMAEGVVKVI